jgi:hypothetical protein
MRNTGRRRVGEREGQKALTRFLTGTYIFTRLWEALAWKLCIDDDKERFPSLT